MPATDFLILLPHLIVLGLAILTLAVDALVRQSPARNAILTILSLVGYALAIIAALALNGQYRTSFAGMAKLDDLAIFLMLVVLIAGFLTVFVSGTTIPRWNMPLGEYYALLAFSVLGGMLVASSNDLVMVFVGIELSSLSIFVLTAFAKRSRESIEGALKYFLLSAFATAILIYGFAWIYGITGSTNLSDINLRLAAYQDHNQPTLLLAALLIVVGLGFKAAAVPFHMWTPDAYQGAPTPVTAFMSAAPKATAFAAFIRVLVQGLEPLRAQWVPLLIALAVLTMAFGNIVAISQRDVKRMLAYSSIAHTGYMLVGLAAFQAIGATDAGISALLFYLFAYTIMNIGAFGIVTWLQSHGRGEMLDDFRGLAASAPLQAAAMAFFLFSLTGVPPLIGFAAKYYIILGAIQAGLTWLAIVVVVLSAVSAFYYLRVVAAMYFGEPERALVRLPARFMGLGLLVMVAGTLFFGIFSGPILDFARQWYLSL
ncbi:MAG TPA: NADH-quinone oxidoreductase subunit N [Thermomicrobiales bacterium]|nr:NADH-quinone oxidoreductase subunit N [Thermomicrobiales bacterium]